MGNRSLRETSSFCRGISKKFSQSSTIDGSEYRVSGLGHSAPREYPLVKEKIK
jgi:hypothetical protein